MRCSFWSIKTFWIHDSLSTKSSVLYKVLDWVGFFICGICLVRKYMYVQLVRLEKTTYVYIWYKNCCNLSFCSVYKLHLDLTNIHYKCTYIVSGVIIFKSKMMMIWNWCLTSSGILKAYSGREHVNLIWIFTVLHWTRPTLWARFL